MRMSGVNTSKTSQQANNKHDKSTNVYLVLYNYHHEIIQIITRSVQSLHKEVEA